MRQEQESNSTNQAPGKSKSNYKGSNFNPNYRNTKPEGTNQTGEKKPYKKPFKKTPFKKPMNEEVQENVAAQTEQGESRRSNEGYKKYPKKNFSSNRGDNNRADQEVGEEREVDANILFGRNPIIEVLKSGRDIEKILIQKGQVEGSIKKIIGDAKAKGIIIVEVEKSKLDELSNREKHQGVVAYVAAKDYSTVEDILEEAKTKGEDPFILILDNIQDPHNLGAIIRSAHNAGVHGIIIPKRRAVGLTSTVSKSSAGAIEYMKVAKVANIAQTIEELKAKGIWVACADLEGQIIYKDNLRGPIGIVIGSEGEGISKNVKSKCDFVVSIPMFGKVTSLNASVAASILVYEVVRQRFF